MASAALMGWDADAGKWRKLVCNAAGKLIIDPSEILENVPTDGEVGKGPTSNWAYDHNAAASAHHVRYADSEARAAIGNLFDALGVVQANVDCNYKYLTNIYRIRLQQNAGSDNYIELQHLASDPNLYFNLRLVAGGYEAGAIQIYNGSVYEKVAVEPVVDSKITTHAANASAHHTRYTDAEAKAAVGYNGTKYWSCNGVHFDGSNPDTDDISKSTGGFMVCNADNISLVAAVFLPHGAVVTNVIVTGNAAAAAETWSLRRYALSDLTSVVMATANVNTADSTIDSATIDNSLYGYILQTSSLDTADRLYGALITYTI